MPIYRVVVQTGAKVLLVLALGAATAQAQEPSAPVAPPMKDMSPTPAPLERQAPPLPNDMRRLPPITSFDALDVQHTGRVTKEAASKDAWLARHFTTCDSNRDGQVTRPEYDICSANAR